MKKKTYLAVITLCLLLAASGCGKQEEQKAAENTQSEAQEESEKETKEESQDKKKDVSDGTRLVTVDNIEKYVSIGQYKGLALDNTVEEITDADVEATIAQTLQDAAEDVSSGTVENGDTVTIDYVGTIDGETFDGGEASNFELVVGSGMMLMPEFEQGIVGMSKGETKELTIEFPEDYVQTDFAGKKAEFKITLQSFKRPAKLTDEWVKNHTDYSTVDEYRASVKKELQDNANTTAKDSLERTAWSTVLSNSEVMEYPEEDIANAAAEFEKETRKYAKQGGMEVEEFLESQGISLEDYEEQRQQYAEYKVKQNLIVQGIMDKEGLSLEDKECLEIQDELIQIYGAKDLADLIDTHGQVSVDESIGLLRVEDFIIENATINDKVSAGGTVGVSGDGGDTLDGTTAEQTDEETGSQEEILEEGKESDELIEDMDAEIQE